jgi:ribose 5-phosphate isomerase A
MVVDYESQKRLAAEEAMRYVQDGTCLGLGSGSTAAVWVRLLGRRVRDGLRIRGVPTSEATRTLAQAEGIPLTSLDEALHIDLTVDGADEVDRNLAMIKGGGGALLREKVVAAFSRRLVIIADSRKLVERLGAFPLPVEVVPFALRPVREQIAAWGGKPVLRLGDDRRPAVTDGGNHILDCSFGVIADPENLARRLDAVAGVVEHGLFLNMADTAIVGREAGVETIRRP